MELLPTALWELFEYDVDSVIYSVGVTELDDDTIDIIGERDEVFWKRHYKNLKDIGFKVFKQNKVDVYYYKDYRKYKIEEQSKNN